MSNDPSRAVYKCIRCDTLPCSCKHEHKPLVHETFSCKALDCNFICYTTNQLAEHVLDRHGRQLIPTYTVNGFHHELETVSAPKPG
jgi:hypothetical protein